MTSVNKSDHERVTSPRFLTISIPTNFAHKKLGHPVGPPGEITIGGDSREKPPATIEVKGAHHAPPPVVVVVEKDNRRYVPDVIQVQDMPQRLPTTRSGLKNISHQGDPEKIPNVNGADTGGISSNAIMNARERTPLVQPLEPDGSHRSTAAPPGQSQIAEATSSHHHHHNQYQPPLTSSLHNKEPPTTGERSDKPLPEVSGKPLPEITLVKRTHPSRTSKQQPLPLASKAVKGTAPTQMVAKPKEVERIRSPDPPAAKAETTSKTILPDYTTMTKQRHSHNNLRYQRNSVSSRTSNDSAQQQLHTANTTQTLLHKSWPAPHVMMGNSILTGSRPRPRTTRTPPWLGATGTPEEWIQATTTKPTEELPHEDRSRISEQGLQP